MVAIAAESDAVEGPWESPGGRAASSGCATRVPVVEPAETRKRDDLAHLGRLKPSMLKGHRPRMSQKGRPGERRNLNRLRHLCLHSETP